MYVGARGREQLMRWNESITMAYKRVELGGSGSKSKGSAVASLDRKSLDSRCRSSGRHSQELGAKWLIVWDSKSCLGLWMLKD